MSGGQTQRRSTTDRIAEKDGVLDARGVAEAQQQLLIARRAGGHVVVTRISLPRPIERHNSVAGAARLAQ